MNTYAELEKQFVMLNMFLNVNTIKKAPIITIEAFKKKNNSSFTILRFNR